jgi:hypothetical protein
MGFDSDRFLTIAARRQQLREADAHERAGIAAAAGAGDAAYDAATGAAGAADAARRLANDLGGPACASSSAVSCAELADHLGHLADAFTRLGAQFSATADRARDDHLAHLRDRIGPVPADYIGDLLRPADDHRPPGHADNCPGFGYHATHPTCPPDGALFLVGFDLD